MMLQHCFLGGVEAGKQLERGVLPAFDVCRGIACVLNTKRQRRGDRCILTHHSQSTRRCVCSQWARGSEGVCYCEYCHACPSMGLFDTIMRGLPATGSPQVRLSGLPQISTTHETSRREDAAPLTSRKVIWFTNSVVVPFARKLSFGRESMSCLQKATS